MFDVVGGMAPIFFFVNKLAARGKVDDRGRSRQAAEQLNPFVLGMLLNTSSSRGGLAYGRALRAS